MKNKKRGQITIFILLGLVLIIATALFIFLVEKQIIFRPELITPPETEPVIDYVEQCVVDISADAITRIGLQGGYLNDSSLKTDPTSYINMGYGFYSVPYWFHDGTLAIPPLSFITEQLEDHISKNLQDCTENFKVFQNKYDFEEEKPTAKVEYVREGIKVTLNYPIKMKDKYEHKEAVLDEFSVLVPADLRSAYDLANKTMMAQHNKFFFENLTIEIMASNSEEFPFTGLEFRCQKDMWRVAEMKQRLQEIMSANLPRVRIKDTDYLPFEKEESFYEAYKKWDFEKTMAGLYGEETLPKPVSEEASDWYEYFHMFYDVGSNSEDMKISFQHQDNWAFEFYPEPQSGGVLQPREIPGSSVLSFICIQLYHYTYDIKYPVLARIYDPEAFFGRGFVFQFAFPVIIDNNEGNHDTFRVEEFQNADYTYEFCDPDENFGTDGYKITVTGVDDQGYPGQKIPDANISYKCMQRICPDIGYTDVYGELNTGLPDGCGNPTIIAEKDGYMKGYATVTGNNVEVKIDKLASLDFKVMKRQYLSGSLRDPEPLQKNENASIFIQKIGSNDNQQLLYCGGCNQQTGKAEFRLEGGEYKIQVLLNRRMHDEVKMTGGYFNNNLSYDFSDLNGKTEITIPVIDYRPTPTTDQQEVDMMFYLMSQQNNQTVWPEIK